MISTGLVVLGLGARSGTLEDELAAAAGAALAAVCLRPADVGVLATLDRRAGEPGPRAVADRNGWRIVAFTAAELATVDVPHPSAEVAHRSGTPSVAEAAALLAAGPGATLILPKLAFPAATVAIARGTGPEA
ncbi:cobalamin biosynthesis protein [Amorphoplanes digitatis]|uniref:Cobalamin biosynthesis protein CbiG n=1 Tax=Actinoplanes digitatis TaxID=1868 RepID=A0A7W7HWV0_9ACTN|nr:cobalamin biosynthesis protein [Actinoplanes digitatis]MBB4762253.1 cobalamin biosynthesis protein CbiG [Actinoplanes digitatis]GID92625.1 precorrin methylase [Actinoplanes digitatis]